MPQTTNFTKVIDALLDQKKTFPASLLHYFSDITAMDLQELMKVWPCLSSRRKQILLEDLEDLVETDTITSFDELAFTLLADQDPLIRASAIRLLKECEQVKFAAILIKMLKEDPDLGVQATAAIGLGSFVMLGELEKIPSKQLRLIEDQLLSVVTGKNDTQVRMQALESLGYSSRPEVVPLIDAAFADKNSDWVISALHGMAHSCDERWKKQVFSKLRSPDETIRYAAIHAAGELELKSASPLLLDMLGVGNDPILHHEIIWALSKIGGEGVRAKLEELCEAEEDEEEIEFIEEALDILTFTDDLGVLSLLEIDPNIRMIEDESDEEA